jgi:putative endonuclease
LNIANLVSRAQRSALRGALQNRDPGWFPMAERFHVYILASRYRGTMYVGVTSDFGRRIEAHKAGSVPGFTKTYKVNRLVHAESYSSISEARVRERVLKRWRRDWKIKLIEVENPRWTDLSDHL